MKGNINLLFRKICCLTILYLINIYMDSLRYSSSSSFDLLWLSPVYFFLLCLSIDFAVQFCSISLFLLSQLCSTNFIIHFTTLSVSLSPYNVSTVVIPPSISSSLLLHSSLTNNNCNSFYQLSSLFFVSITNHYHLFYRFLHSRSCSSLIIIVIINACYVIDKE